MAQIASPHPGFDAPQGGGPQVVAPLLIAPPLHFAGCAVEDPGPWLYGGIVAGLRLVFIPGAGFLAEITARHPAMQWQGSCSSRFSMLWKAMQRRLSTTKVP